MIISIAVIIILAGISALLTGIFMTKRSVLMISFLSEFSEGCNRYEATVLDVHKEAVKSKKNKEQTVIIVQFRIEEQKRTVVHRCTEKFYNPYSRGDKITLLFKEGISEDTALIEGDNSYEHMSAIYKKLKMPLSVSGYIMTGAGIIMLLTEIFL